MKKNSVRRQPKMKLDTYLKLVEEFPLVEIQNEEHLIAASKFLDHVLQLGRLDSGETAYLNALTLIVEVYEEEHIKFPSTTPASRLRHLIEDAKGCTQADVSRATGISQGNLSEILKGRRRIALSHLAPLAKFFHVPQSVFLEDA